MRPPQRVVWSEGMLISPQHLQQQDRYHEALLSERLRAYSPHAWGVVELVLEEAGAEPPRLREGRQEQRVEPHEEPGDEKPGYTESAYGRPEYREPEYPGGYGESEYEQPSYRRPDYAEPEYREPSSGPPPQSPPPPSAPQHSGDWEGGEWTGSHRAATGGRRGTSVARIRKDTR